MPLGREEDIVLDGTQLSQRATTPNFRPLSVVAKRLDGSRYGGIDLGPGHIVLDGDPAPLNPRKGHSTASFRPMSIVA